jgi:hypothetical protein
VPIISLLLVRLSEAESPPKVVSVFYFPNLNPSGPPTMPPADPQEVPLTTSSSGTNEEAIDDGDELDGDFVQLQKTRSQKRRAAKDISDSRINKVLPFAFSPNIRPLCVSDIDSVIALENAAFHDPQHRATREKVIVTSF